MKYKLTIPQPCAEKWSEMTLTDKGAFCSNCQKEVKDFTFKSSNQLAHILDSNEKICGKFRHDQLNININSTEKTSYPKMPLLLAVSTLLSLSAPVFAQSRSAAIDKLGQINGTIENVFTSTKVTDSIEIRGHVFEEYGPLPGANIYFRDHSYATKTDMNGNFSIKIVREKVISDPFLIISFIGFETQEISINQKTDFLNIEMTEDEMIMGEVVIVRKQNIFRRIGKLFRKNN